MHHHHPRSRLAAILLLSLGALAMSASAQAQSSYTLSVLKPGANDSKIATPLFIDAQSRVTSTTRFLTGYVFVPASFSFAPAYANFASRWAATSSSSVAPTKLAGKNSSLFATSSSGSKVVVHEGDYKLVDTATNRSQALLPADVVGNDTSRYLPRPSAVNDAGWVAGSYVDGDVPYPTQLSEVSHAVLWRPGQRGETLPVSSDFVGAQAVVVNGSGVVAGQIYEPATVIMRAAKWTQGVMEVLERQPGKGSFPVAINNAGQVLIGVMPATVLTVPTIDGGTRQDHAYGDASYALVTNGVLTPIAPTVPGAVVAQALNASGTVVGRVGGRAFSGEPLAGSLGSRAFLWKNGVMSDLTTLVQSKGVKLPAGAVLENAVAINDLGSIVAVYRDAKNALVVVRLTAKP